MRAKRHYKLHRCLICKKFGAYIKPETGAGYVCYKCWYAQWKASHPEGATGKPPKPPQAS